MTDAITYDDVLLVPSYNHWESRRVVDISVKDMSGKLHLELPIMSSNMDTITESEMADFIGETNFIEATITAIVLLLVVVPVIIVIIIIIAAVVVAVALAAGDGRDNSNCLRPTTPTIAVIAGACCGGCCYAAVIIIVIVTMTTPFL